MTNTNASNTQKGFHYQDFCALYFFVNNVKKIKSINDEGKEDFDVLYIDDKVGFFQAKEISNNQNLQGKNINQSLKVLLDDYKSVSYDDLKELGIITNTSLPFGQKTDNAFNQPYMKYNYNSLSQKEKDVINKQAKIYKIDIDNPKLLNKLTVTRIQYQGQDEQSKFQELRKRTENLINDARIYSGNTTSLMNEWIKMFTHNTEYPNVNVNKEQFTAHTEMTVLDRPNFDKFFDIFDDDINEEYIKNEYHTTLAKVCLNFSIKNKIENEFFIFKKQHLDIKRQDRFKSFTENFAEEVTKMVGLTNKNDDLCIAKLIIWLIIRQKHICQDIEESFNFENKIPLY